MKILVVCLGNICRSPIAEGVLRGKFEKYHIQGKIDSAGVIGYHAGEPPDERAVTVARENGLDISRQRARRFRTSDFDEFDLILTMDEEVQMEISEQAANSDQRKKVILFLVYAGATGSGIVPDPYYGNLDGFRNVFKMIDQAGEDIAGRLSKPKS